ncbi:MAG: putative abductin-like protein [Myxococcales bacterium]|nr:putative abductin-like protein [Myxococcales bacterium]
MRSASLALVLCLSACSGGGDDQQKAKLATDLVQCRNDLTNLKEQVAEAKAQLQKALEAKTCLLEPVDIKAANAGQKHMEGNIAPEAVMKVVKQNSGGLRACYEKALKRKPDLQYVSAVTAKFQIENTGTAKGVTFAPHTDPEMERCMAQTMEKWRFPTFQGDPVAFEQPVNLVAK